MTQDSEFPFDRARHVTPEEHQRFKAMIKQRLLEAIDCAPAAELESTLTFLEHRLTLQPPDANYPAKAVSILKQLARLNACATIEDPIAWQNEMRLDRPLPGRDD
jgi:hypothetical protein